MRAPSVTAVIPVHNGADLLERLLASIGSQTVPFAEIVVVDDASADDAPDVARRHGCRVIAMGTNAGFARAVNAGCKAAATEWVAIINSDVELDRTWLERLLAEAGGAAFATGTLLDAADRSRVDGTYDLVSRAGCAWRAGHGEKLSASATQSQPIAVAPATACIFRREELEKAGGFDESFESYLEDVDLGLRFLRDGVCGVWVPCAVAWHRGSATFGKWSARATRLIARNQLLLLARHYDAALFRQCFRQILVGQLLWGFVAIRHGRGLAWLKGKLDGLRGFRFEGRPSPALRDFLSASEKELRTRALRDAYWRWYFRLAGAAD